MVYKPGASHHLPDFLSRASTVAQPEDIHDNIPFLALAETANGLRTGMYTDTDTPEPVEFDDVVEAQQADDYCVEMSTRVERGTAKAFFLNQHHALYRRTPYGNQLVIPKSLRERVLTLKHHATVAAHPGMNRMYYTMQKSYFWPSMVTDIHTTIPKCTICAQNHLALRRHTTTMTLFPATEPLTEVSVDIFGRFTASKKGNRLILGIADPPILSSSTRNGSWRYGSCGTGHLLVNRSRKQLLSTNLRRPIGSPSATSVQNRDPSFS